MRVWSLIMAGFVLVAAACTSGPAPTSTPIPTPTPTPTSTPTPTTTTATPPCADGVAVPLPEVNPDLVADCVTLLKVRNTLTGGGKLNWSADIPVSGWDGVEVEDIGFRTRIDGLRLAEKGLFGEIPAELGEITSLRVLELDRNFLTASYLRNWATWKDWKS